MTVCNIANKKSNTKIKKKINNNSYLLEQLLL